ncbi:MAG: response regulator [Spirochaetales bacterium]|nr:response regulator [Spirochaetales bacterium]
MTRKINCIIAEDDFLIRSAEIELLKRIGLNVIAKTANGRDTLEAVKQLHPDIVFLDINMAYRTEGIDCAKQINHENPDVKIVFLSSYSADSFNNELADINYHGYIIKIPSINAVKKCLDVLIS